MAERVLENGAAVVKRCRHGLFLYNKNDLVIGRSLDLYGEWAQQEMEFLGRLIKPGDLIIDIGANIGTHTAFFAKQVGQEGFVIAVEPQRLVFEMLCANLALNNLVNVLPVHAAVGAEPSSVRIPVLDPTVEQNFGSASISGDENGEWVNLIPVDRLPVSDCALIKVDVEGMEAEVLRGAVRTIARFRPKLFMECNSREAAARLFPILKGQNYRIYWHAAPSYYSENYFRNAVNIFAGYPSEVNILCIPEEKPLESCNLQEAIGPEEFPPIIKK